MHKNIFVTGIGTGVGKTVTSAILARALDIPYWKPIQCGDLDQSDEHTVKALDPNIVTLPTQYAFQTPCSPHEAAARENVEIDLQKFEIPKTATVIEGAGGLLVPLNSKHFIADLISHLNASVVVVGQYYLGSINHTLLTLSELKHRNISVLGIIFNGTKNQQTKDIILKHHELPVLLEIPELDSIGPETISSYATILKKNMHELL